MEFTKEQIEQINKMMEEKMKTSETKPKEDPKPKEEPKPKAEKSDLDKEIEVAKKTLELKKIKKETEELGKEPQEEDEGAFSVNGNETTSAQATDEDWKIVSELTK